MLQHIPESTIYKYLVDLIPTLKAPVIIEIGAHWAEDTRRLLNLCKTPPKYLAFEPDPRNIQRIKKELPSLKYPVTLIEKAVCNKDGSMELHLSDGTHHRSGNKMTGANSILSPKVVKQRHGWIKFNDTVEVETCRLDTIYNEYQLPYIDFIWADMQGAEYLMIKGAQNTLKNTKYAFLEYSDVELYSGQKTIKDYMKALTPTGEWEIIHQWSTDVLIQNKSLLK